MLTAERLAVHFGARTLFEDVSFLIRPHDRIGLTGTNGSGKTTLLRVLAGQQEPDAGALRAAGFVTVGYLPQDGISVRGRTLYDEVESSFDDVLALQRRLDTALAELSTMPPDAAEHAEILEVAGELQHRLEDHDVYTMRSRIEKVLMGLGFGVADLSRLTDEFSGGWQMRIALAKLLLRTPSVLLLDEPTNHLDIESLAWLEEYLEGYDGAVVVVSHDAVFLDRIATRTLALDRQSVEDFPGRFSAYLDHVASRREQLERDYASQQQRIRQTQQFIDRFRYKASKARQVQSRIKHLEKMDRVELEGGTEEIDFTFPPPPSSGRVLLTLREVDKSYGSRALFNRLSLTIDRGDRMAIVGVNGAGKSTLLRILAGTESFQSGDRIPGHNLVVSYYAQHQADELDPTLDVLGVVDRVAEGDIRRKLRSILGSFLFHGDDVFKPVPVLSGGEKSRLALARMLLQPANLLLLDEPTNHLDLRSKSVLQDALLAYEGSYVIVSHDRGFLDPVVTKVLEVSPRGLRTFHGTVSDYLERRQTELKGAREEPAGRGSTKAPSSRDRKRLEADIRKEKSEATMPLRKRLTEVEASIERLEGEVERRENQLADPGFYASGGDMKTAGVELKAYRSELESALASWEELGTQLQSIEKVFDERLRTLST